MSVIEKVKNRNPLSSSCVVNATFFESTGRAGASRHPVRWFGVVRESTLGSFLQLLGAGCLVVVVLTHLCEALHLFPRMQWGSEHSVGHYLDLRSAVLGLTLFPIW